jgi:hypothetical protein
MLTYLASPYSAKGITDEYEATVVREKRFIEASIMAARLMEQGHKVFAPIPHSHPIEHYGLPEIRSGDWWLQQDYEVLQYCGLLLVYTMDGWDQSYGIGQEVAFAQERGIPVKYINKNGEISDQPVSAVHPSEPVRPVRGGQGQARDVGRNSEAVLRLLEGEVSNPIPV